MSCRFLDHPGPIPIAHRGGAGDWPENTFPAFENAISLGFRYVETDVHVTVDGQLIAFHDDRLDRVTDRVGIVRDLPWSEVSLARVNGEEAIPLLEDLLGTWPELMVNIDPKHDDAVDVLADVLRRTDSVDRVCIGSFSDRRLTRIRRMLGPDVCTSMGPREVARLRAGSFGVPTWRFAAPCVQIPPRVRNHTLVDERLVTYAHRRKLAVHVWTVDEPWEIERLLDIGVDGIMTDRPSVLRDVLRDRGQWSG